MDRQPNNSTPAAPQELSRAWLEARPVEHRPRISHHAHLAGQEGVTDPETVLARVAEGLRRRLRYAQAEEAAGLRDDLAALSRDRNSALQYAAWIIHYWQLNPAERQRVKAERSRPHLDAWMGTVAPTGAQIGYLRLLGHNGPPPPTRRAASDLITRLRAQGR